MQIYSPTELKFQQKIKVEKARLLKPLLKTLTKIKISPNHLTLTGLALSLISLSYKNFTLAVIIQFGFDFLDGALALYQKKQTKLGSKLDILADYTFVTLASIYWTLETQTSHTQIIIYLILVYTQNLLQITANNKHITHKIIGRPRISILIIQALNLSYVISNTLTTHLISLAIITMTIQSVYLGLKLAKNKKNS